MIQAQTASRLILILVLITAVMASLSALTGAVDVNEEFCRTNGDLLVCQADFNQSATENTFVGENGIITRIARALVWASGAIAAILIIIAGLMFIFSGGNPESAGRARRTLLYAIIGVIVAVSGQAIVTFVLEKL